jgi:hypothetical protein
VTRLTGRDGLRARQIRIFDSVGLRSAEIETKDRGARFINRFGPLAPERIRP